MDKPNRYDLWVALREAEIWFREVDSEFEEDRVQNCDYWEAQGEYYGALQAWRDYSYPTN